MKKETLYIAVCNQKGGVGKSALTVTIASYLHYQKDLNVAIVDCDNLQHSILKMRNSDIETIDANPRLQAALEKQFDRNQKKSYRIISVVAESALHDAQQLLETSEKHIDILFFDLPGSFDSAGILNVIFNMDYLFVPIIADKRVLQSSLSFVLSVKAYMEELKKTKLKEIRMFWNRVDKRENTELYDLFSRILQQENIPIMETSLPDSKKYNKELSLDKDVVFRSTLFPPDKKMLRSSNLEKLIEEIRKIIKV